MPDPRLTRFDIAWQALEHDDLEAAGPVFRELRDQGLGIAEIGLAWVEFHGSSPAAGVARMRAACEQELPTAWAQLGLMMQHHGDDPDEIREVYRRGGEGDAECWLDLAFFERSQGRSEAAFPAAHRAVAAGSATARAILACWDWDRTHDPALEEALRDGQDLFPGARADLGTLLWESGRRNEAIATLEQGVARAEIDAMVVLANLLVDDGRTDHAEALYRRAAGSGDHNALDNLVGLLRATGRPTEALRARLSTRRQPEHARYFRGRRSRPAR